MADLFFFGTLCHAPLRAAVLGREVEARAATLSDHLVFWADGQSFPLLIASPGGTVLGQLVRGLMADDLDRLEYYSGGSGAKPRQMIAQSDGPVEVQVYVPDISQGRPGAPWRIEDWVARWGDVVTSTARDVMALRGRKPAAEVRARYDQMMVRGASRVRATGAPATLRHDAGPGDVVVTAQHQPYANFFAVEEYDVSWRRFDGSQSATVNRAAFISGDAVTVLPYDPLRDRVLLIEQFRAGPYARGDDQPWLLEVIAGRIDPGETPEEAARREAVEEAGLTLGPIDRKSVV